MRLNLLPTTVKKGPQARTATFVSVLIVLVCIAGAAFMIMDSGNQVTYAKNADAKEQPGYNENDALQKDTVKVLADSGDVLRNVNLYEAMDKHTDEYPKLYNFVKQYIPNFYRLTSLTAESAGPESSTITMVGVIGSFQDYADLMLALLRIPQPYGPVVSIGRSGFQHTEAFVPPVDETDKLGRVRKPGSNPVPDDPLKRLEYYINQGSTTQLGYQALANYGSGQPGARGPRVGESLVTIRMVVPYNLQTPDPRATLSLFGSAAPAAGTTAPAGPPTTTTPPPVTTPGGSDGPGAPSSRTGRRPAGGKAGASDE